jgi:uncharacterized membrane protein HdeD (DUF308 family)
MSQGITGAPRVWNPISPEITGRWWVLGLRGVAGILLGIAAFVWPGITLLVLVVLFGAYLLVDGVFALAGGAMGRSWLLILIGALGVIAGILTLVWPGITALVLVFLAAARFIVGGAFELIAAIRLRRVIDNEWLLIVVGVLSILFGVLLFAFPAAGLLTLVYLIGAYAFVIGVLFLALAFRLRSRRASPARAG